MAGLAGFAGCLSYTLGGLAVRTVGAVRTDIAEAVLLSSCSFCLFIKYVYDRRSHALKIAACCLKAVEDLRVVGYFTGHDYEQEMLRIYGTVKARSPGQIRSVGEDPSDIDTECLECPVCKHLDRIIVKIVFALDTEAL